MGKTTAPLLQFSLLLLLTTLIFSTTTAQLCKTHTFTNNQQFASCVDLPVLNSFLHWTYDPNNRTARIAFRATGVTSSNWVAWALNPTGSGMIGAQALVAYTNSTSGVAAHTSSVTSTGTTLAPSSLSFPVPNISAAMIAGGEMVIFATIRPPATKVNQVWQVGPLSNGAPSQHSLTGGNARSMGSIDFMSGQTTSSGSDASSRQRKRNIHGVLNAVSWGILMPLGAIVARYMRVFKSADPAWFYLHITCQFSAYVVGIAGWGTGLKLGSQSPGITYHSHRNIGITLFCFATLQVFALLLRPKKEHKYRLYWNMYHHTIGYAVIILSVINVFKGFHILDPDNNKWKRAYIGVLIALGAIAVALEAFTWMVVLKRKKENSGKHDHSSNGANGHNNGYGNRTQPVV